MSQAGFAEAISSRMKESGKVISSYRFFTFNDDYKVVGGRAEYFPFTAGWRKVHLPRLSFKG